MASPEFPEFPEGLVTGGVSRFSLGVLVRGHGIHNSTSMIIIKSDESKCDVTVRPRPFSPIFDLKLEPCIRTCGRQGTCGLHPRVSCVDVDVAGGI